MLLIDAHVHIYNCFDLEKFFNSAYDNIKSEAEKLGHADAFTGILLLAETSRDNWFHHLSNWADEGRLPINRNAGDWRFYRTKERCSLHARSDDTRELFIIAGRQFVTLEGLEVLSLASTNSFPEGLPITKLLSNVRDNGGKPVIPWGFGKWMGRRGKILRELIEATENGDFSLGDNRGRPSLLPTPYHFNLAPKKRIRILPGTDPLPFRSEQNRVGSFGLSLEVEIDPEFPAQDMKETIFSDNYNFYPYGSMEKNLRFILKQIRMQLKKGIR